MSFKEILKEYWDVALIWSGLVVGLPLLFNALF